jgi:hypothetical protein
LNLGRATFLSASIDPDGRGGLRIGTPQKLFELSGGGYTPERNILSYSPHPDGRRLMIDAFAQESRPTINVVTHWQRAVAGRTPP